MQFNLDECQSYEQEIIDAILRVIHNKKYILSDEGASFEKEWAGFHAAPFAVGVGSGTDALRIALIALGVKPGDEVITPAFNVAYTAQAVKAIGAKNVYVDVDPNTMLMDLNKLDRVITKKTRAIVPVHLFGRMVNMKQLSQIAKDYRLLLVEDAAQAHGARDVTGRYPGYYSDAACYSHYPTKNLGALGEAGSIVTKLPVVDKYARLLRDAGRVDRYIHMIPGINSCLDEIHAAVLRVKLPRLLDSNYRRRYAAKQYIERLRGVGDLKLPEPSTNDVYHLFVARTQYRDELMAFLKNRNIPTLSHYPCTLPNQPFAKVEALDQGPFPVAEECARTVLSLPMFPDISRQEIDEVCMAIWDYYEA